MFKYIYRLPGLSNYSFDKYGACYNMKTCSPLCGTKSYYRLVNDRGEKERVSFAEVRQYVKHMECRSCFYE